MTRQTPGTTWLCTLIMATNCMLSEPSERMMWSPDGGASDASTGSEATVEVGLPGDVQDVASDVLLEDARVDGGADVDVPDGDDAYVATDSMDGADTDRADADSADADGASGDRVDVAGDAPSPPRDRVGDVQRPDGDVVAPDVPDVPDVPDASSPVDVSSCGMLSSCGTTCVDLRSSAAHCGACGRSCLAWQFCVAGACGVPCGTSFCVGGLLCQAGVCVAACSSGQRACSGVCTNTMTDPMNCGGCDQVCGDVCRSGSCVASCVFPPCPAPV